MNALMDDLATEKKKPTLQLVDGASIFVRLEDPLVANSATSAFVSLYLSKTSSSRDFLIFSVQRADERNDESSVSTENARKIRF